MQSFRDLKVWQKGHELTLDVYAATASFPKSEAYGIIGQLRRACVSIPANLAEGCGRGSDADFNRFVQIAMGSASETEYFLLLARDLNYLVASDHQKLERKIIEIKRMLTSLIQTLKPNR